MLAHLLGLLTGLWKFFEGDLDEKRYGFLWLGRTAILVKYFSF